MCDIEEPGTFTKETNIYYILKINFRVEKVIAGFKGKILKVFYDAKAQTVEILDTRKRKDLTFPRNVPLVTEFLILTLYEKS